jgi:hypothetical protein
MQASLTIQTAMQQEHQLGFLKNEDPMAAEMIVSMMIELIAEQFNVKDTFSDIQILDCTLSVMERFWYLRLEEILFTFKQAKLVKYGPVYNRLDTQTILTWLHKYDTEDRLRQIDVFQDAYKKQKLNPRSTSSKPTKTS